MNSVTDWTISKKGGHVEPLLDGGAGKPWIPYVRVSTLKQEQDGASLEVQELAIAQFAKERGLLLAPVVRESRSAESIFGRPALVDALDAVLAGEANGIVAMCRDRVTRDIIDRRCIITPFKRAGRLLEVVAVETDESADGKFVETILSALEERERLRIAERTRVASQAKKARGGHVGGAPYGWQYDPAAPKGRKDALVAKWPEHACYLWIRALVASGRDIDGVTEALSVSGFNAPRGVQWSRSVVGVLVGRICRAEGWPSYGSERRDMARGIVERAWADALAGAERAEIELPFSLEEPL